MRLLCILIIIGVVFADYGGGYAGSGFRYGSNAREFSLAGALVADKTPGFYAFSNPALLRLSRDNHIGISFQNMSFERSIQSFSFSRRLPPSGGVGLAILKSGTDKIMGRDGGNNKQKNFQLMKLKVLSLLVLALAQNLHLGLI